jgi:hypothetical protein
MNMRIFDEILKGKKGPHRDIVVLNSAYALYIDEAPTEEALQQVEGYDDLVRWATPPFDRDAAQQRIVRSMRTREDREFYAGKKVTYVALVPFMAKRTFVQGKFKRLSETPFKGLKRPSGR